MAEEEQQEENIYDRIRRAAREKQEAEKERRERFQKFMESGGRPLWEQKLKR